VDDALKNPQRLRFVYEKSLTKIRLLSSYSYPLRRINTVLILPTGQARVGGQVHGGYNIDGTPCCKGTQCMLASTASHRQASPIRVIILCVTEPRSLYKL